MYPQSGKLAKKMTVKEHPVYHKQVLESSENRTSKMTQLTLMNYIKLRFVYELAYENWDQINRECHDLVTCINDNDHEGESKAKNALLNCLERFGRISVIDVVSGFFRLYQQVEDYKSRMDILHVFA